MDSEESRERSKENRRSFFGGVGNGVVTGRGRGAMNEVELDEKDEDAEWVTHSDLTSASGAGGKDGLGRRSSSSQRPDTATSVGSRVGSVRKRLSMLKLGKKSSKASVLVGSVAEED